MHELLAAIAAGRSEPVYLVHGDRALAEPSAVRLASALGESFGCVPQTLRRPDSLADVVADLRTFSLFADGKVIVVIESGVLADRASASELFEEIRPELPWSGGAGDLKGGAREAALRLLQVLRLFDLDPQSAPPERLLAELPDALLAGKSGRAGRGKAGSADETRAALASMLTAALEAGLRGIGQEDASQVADLLRDGLPDRQVLVLVESAVAEDHPLLAALERRGAAVAAGRLSSERGRFGGLAPLVAELERQTGAAIERAALDELARRTLRTEGARGPVAGGVDADSAARFGGEYRKLAALSGGGRIGLALVEESVEDRGDEDVWKILDDLGAGRSQEALSRLQRRLAGADDPILERLSFFALLAAFCRHLVAVRGAQQLGGVAGGERDFNRFKQRPALALRGDLPGLTKNPLAGLKEYRLFKAYLAAQRLTLEQLARLPERVLETERRLKGDSGDPEAALAELVLELARSGAPAPPPRGAARG